MKKFLISLSLVLFVAIFGIFTKAHASFFSGSIKVVSSALNTVTTQNVAPVSQATDLEISIKKDVLTKNLSFLWEKVVAVFPVLKSSALAGMIDASRASMVATVQHPKVLGITTAAPASKHLSASSSIEEYIKEQVNASIQYLVNKGTLKGEKGDRGDQGLPAPTVYLQGMLPAVGTTGSGPISGGGTISGATYFSSNYLTSTNLTNTDSFVSNGTATFNGVTSLNGTTTIANLVSNTFNPGLTEGSLVFQGDNGLSQDNSSLFWDSTNKRLRIGAAQASATSSVISDGLIGYWSFNRNTGGLIMDDSGNGNNGVVTGNPWAPGKVGGGMHFVGGVDNAVIISPLKNAPATTLTVAFWLRTRDLSQAQMFTYATGYRGPHNYDILIFNPKGMNMYIVNSFLTPYNVAVNDGEWHHLAMTWESSTGLKQLYQDGVLVSSVTDAMSIGSVIPANGCLVFGQNEENPCFGFGFVTRNGINGDMDEIAFYNRVLSNSEIQALYANTTENNTAFPSAAQFMITNDKPATVGSKTGTSPDNAMVVYGGNGGDTSVATAGTGGNGGSVAFTGGAGGQALAALQDAYGGLGGTLTMSGGAGGQAAVAGTGNNTGGLGGVLSLSAGIGGAATGNTTGLNMAGNGGQVVIQGGAGGFASNDNATPNQILGGEGGFVTVRAGMGGWATTTSVTTGTIQGGTGGAMLLTAGEGGFGVTRGGTGGAMTIAAGAGGYSPQTGGSGGTLTLQGGAAMASSTGSSGGAVIVSGAAGSDNGSGGAGGAVTITAGSAGGDNTTGRSGGAVSITAGASKGNQSGGAIILTTGVGGSNLASTTSATGPASGSIQLTIAAGGTAPSSTVSSTGGAGGSFTLQGGTGGVANQSVTTTNTGGAGSNIVLNLGAGGAVANAGTTNTGGAGGTFQLNGGTGGTATSNIGNNTGGAGSAFAMTTGTGGAATGATSGSNTGGASGNITLTASSGGIASNASTTNTGGTAGALTLQGGTGGAGTSVFGNNFGGSGSALALLAGAGGAASGATDGNNTGGAGGAISITAGTGGAATNGNATLQGGNGGTLTLSGGVGGVGATAGGNGGAVTIQGGSAAAAPGSAGGGVNITGRTGSTTGSGGAGGGVAITGGAAGGDHTVARTGGAISLTAGASRGNQGGAAITLTAGAGGQNVATTSSATGPAGGLMTLTLGAGGTAPNSTDTSVGGAGGTFSITGGAGGAANQSVTTSNAGGAGSAITLNLGVGGAVANAGTTNTGGAGGTFTLQGGTGGAATSVTGNNTGGAGSAVTITAGTGGAASGTTSGNNTGGNGGVITLSGGTGGTAANASGALQGGNGGAVTIQGGSAAAAPGSAGGGVNITGRAGSTTGTGGAGGAITLTAGAAGGDNTVARAGGAISLTAGVSRGNTPGATISLTAGAAGSNLATTSSATGPNGGAISLTVGSGGTAPSSTDVSTGGNAGGFVLTAGSGGAANQIVTTTNTGGVGSAITLALGAGGAASNAGTANNGGGGGLLSITGGTGGAVTTAAVTNNGGNGSGMTFTLGAGGSATGATNSSVGGNGGVHTITGGTGGTATAVTGNNLGGTGSNFTWTAGTGGGATGATSGNNTGGTGGSVTIKAGTGGAASNASGTIQGGNGGDFTIQGGIGGTGSGGTAGNGGAIIFQTAQTTAATERMRITNAGKIGIGTAAPLASLTVLDNNGPQLQIAKQYAASANATTSLAAAASYVHLGGAERGLNSYRVISFGYLYNNNTYTYAPAYMGYQETNTNNSTFGDLIFGTRNSNLDVQPSEVLRITSTGRFGMNTSTPSGTLHVFSSAANITTAIVQATTSQTSNLMEWRNSAGTILSTIDSTGKLGIGTTSPSAMLHVGSALNGGNVRIANGWLCVDDNDTCTGATASGTVYAVSAYTTGADVAENYPTLDGSLSAGEIVSTDNGTPVHVIRATSTRSILGIVSTQPGLLLNGYKSEQFAAARSVPVALSGRVPVKVSNERGQIHIGDYLTLSASQPGVAVKATYSAEVIGQALENQDGANDTILVFVKIGFQNINNTFVLTDNDGQLSTATSTLATSNSQPATGFLINQKGSGNILQLQHNGENRFLVTNDGSVQILANKTFQHSCPGSNDVVQARGSLSCNNVLTVRNGTTSLFSIDVVGNITTVGHITVGHDTAGKALIKAGDNRTTVTFTNPYGSAPVVVATPQGIVVPVAVTDVSGTGFTIMTTEPVTQDVAINWVVMYQPDDVPSVSSLHLTVVSAPSVVSAAPGEVQSASGSAPVTSEGGQAAPQSDSGLVAGTSTPESALVNTSTDSNPAPSEQVSATETQNTNQ